MDLKKAYDLFSSKIKKSSATYTNINSSGDGCFLSVLYFLKTYKDYIVYYSTNNKDPRISKISNLSKKEEALLGDLLESCVIYIDTLSLDAKNILQESKDMKDPLNLVDLVLEEYLNFIFSSNENYEKIISSTFSILIKNNFESVLKALFLKYSYIKKWK